MEEEQENKSENTICEADLEQGSIELAESVSNKFTVAPSDAQHMFLMVFCSIAISLKKIAEEANTVTANMRFDK